MGLESMYSTSSQSPTSGIESSMPLDPAWVESVLAEFQEDDSLSFMRSMDLNTTLPASPITENGGNNLLDDMSSPRGRALPQEPPLPDLRTGQEMTTLQVLQHEMGLQSLLTPPTPYSSRRASPEPTPTPQESKSRSKRTSGGNRSKRKSPPGESKSETRSLNWAPKTLSQKKYDEARVPQCSTAMEPPNKHSPVAKSFAHFKVPDADFTPNQYDGPSEQYYCAVEGF